MTLPRATPHLHGQDRALAAFHAAAAAGRLHHGWLLTGPAGIGKASFAYRAARWLLAGGTGPNLHTDPAHPVFHRVAAGTHPDLFTVERRMNDKDRLQAIINVDTVREAGAFMRLTPAEGGWRAVVVDGAEALNPAAANALLKILEEPPARAVLFLVADTPQKLLPTLRSRCRLMPMAPLSDAAMTLLLRHHHPDMPAAGHARLLALAEGSIGRALALAADPAGIAGFVEEALAAPVPPARAQAIADAVTRATDGADQFAAFMSLLRAGLAAATRAAARQNAPNLAGKVAVWQEFGTLEREVIGLNLDKRAAVIVALETLHEQAWGT